MKRYAEFRAMTETGAIVSQKVCFEFRLGGKGKRRGFIHFGCASCERDGKTFTLDTMVVVPTADLAGQQCVVCRGPMLEPGEEQ
jgi:hypothetical protein